MTLTACCICEKEVCRDEGGIELYEARTGRYPNPNEVTDVRVGHTVCLDKYSGYWVAFDRIKLGAKKHEGDDTVDGWISHLRNKPWFHRGTEREFRYAAMAHLANTP